MFPQKKFVFSWRAVLVDCHLGMLKEVNEHAWGRAKRNNACPGWNEAVDFWVIPLLQAEEMPLKGN